jgi:hypothetical protein
MGSTAEQQAASVLPPRRGAVWAVTVDSTARAYDMTALSLAGEAPEAAASRAQHVMLYLQAETNDVYFYFDSATGNSLSDTTKQSASAAAVAMAAEHCAVLKAGNPPLRVRINRSVDKFIQVKAASTSGVLRMWAASPSV